MAQQCMTEKAPLSAEARARNLAVGNRIRTLRLQKGYTQSFVSVSVGLSPNACAQWETGNAMAKIEHLEQVGLLLGATTQWLMTGDEGGELDKVHTTAEREILAIVRAIPVSNHGTAIEVLKGFIPKPKK